MYDKRRVNTRNIVMCPWCLEQFPSEKAWEEAFTENHPLVTKADSILPIFNTPSN